MPEHPFEPQEMVGWLQPRVLAASAREVVLSKLFADFADKREQQAGIAQGALPCEAREDGRFWLDYVSDSGDGYDTTASIARLLAKEDITIEGQETCRGRVLVLGGDQVYPSASWERYQDRFVGPYSEAFPSGAGGETPTLYAVPGNHDWYDGLTSFMRLFCQGRAIGGWETKQTRSYFALRLPHGWWLWAIDIQLDRYIDGPQVKYFRERAREAVKGDKVILATAKPSWVTFGEPGRDTQPWESLAFLEHDLIGKESGGKARLALTLTGDLHHYSRYLEAPGEGPRQQKITAGGGGAYLSATHWLRDELQLPSFRDDVADSRYTCAHKWPSSETSEHLRWGLLAHCWPLRTFSLNGVLAAIYAALALLVAAGVKDNATGLHDARDGLGWALAGDAVTSWLVLAAGLLCAVLSAFATHEDVRPGWLAGLIHAGMQLASAFVATLLLLHLGATWWPELAREGFYLGYLAACAAAVVGIALGRVIFVLNLLGAHLLSPRSYSNTVFAAQSRQAGKRFKHFLRLRIDPDGKLTVFPIGVADPADEWVIGPEGRREPATEIVPEWVEAPFAVD